MTTPLRRWAGILHMTLQEARADRISIVSSGVAFRVALAIFPGVALLLWTGRRLMGPEETQAFLQMVEAVMPGTAVQVIRQAVSTSAAHGPGDRASGGQMLGLTAPLVGLAFTMWSTNSGMAALFDALNIIYDKTERRSYPVFLALTLAFTVSTLVLILLGTVLVMAAPGVLAATHVPSPLQPWIVGLRWPVLLVVLALGLAVLYRYAPNRERERWPVISVGSTLAAVLVVLTSAAFSWLVPLFASFSVTYGSLGGVAAYMLWLWAIFIVVLLGGELDACIESETGLYRTGSVPKRKAIPQQVR